MATSTQKRSVASGAYDLLYIGAIVAGFVAICASLVGRASIWFDEAFGAYLIQFDLPQLTHYTGVDVHPPLYYYLLKGWSLLFGTSDVALRSMSILFGVIALVVAFYFIRRFFGRKAAYISVLFLALSPMFIRYSIEMRMYTLVVAIVLSATYVLLAATRSSNARRLWVLYGVLLAVGMLTHYLVAIAWISHWIWRLIMTKQKGFKRWMKQFFSKSWILAHVLALALFAPWLPWFVMRFGDVQSNGFWIPPVNPKILLDYVTNFFTYQNAQGVGSYVTILLLVLFVGAVIFIPKLSKRLMVKKTRDAYTLVASMAVLPVLLLVLISLPPLQSAFMDRYLVASLAFSALLLGILIVTLWEKRPRLAYVSGSAVIVLFVIGVFNVAHYGNYNKMDNTSSQTRQAVELIRETDHAAQPIITTSPWVYYEAAQYEREDSTIHFIDEHTGYPFGSLRMLEENDRGKIMNFDEFVEQHGDVWYLGRPGEKGLSPPYEDMTAVESVYLSDRVTGKPAYQATLYRRD